jgi:hypothetical protein
MVTRFWHALARLCARIGNHAIDASVAARDRAYAKERQPLEHAWRPGHENTKTARDLRLVKPEPKP